MRHRLPRPPVKIVLLAAAVPLVVAVLGVGLYNAAIYQAPPVASSGPPAIGPAAREFGRCGAVPASAPRQLRGALSGIGQALVTRGVSARNHDEAGPR